MDDDADDPKTPWRSVILSGCFSIFTGMQFGLFVASMWPYLQILDPLSTEYFLGWVVASYSLGQIIASPIVGYISNRLKTIRLPVVICIALQVVGNLGYMSAQLVESDRRWMILMARFVSGIGSANLGLLRTFCASASTVQDRPRSIAFGTGGLALGLALGPAIQTLFVPVGYGWTLFQNFQLNMYTSPAMFACLINLVAIFTMLFAFEERYAGLANEKVNKKEDKIYIPPYDRLALLACYFGRFTHMFAFTNIETISSPLSMTIFAWTKSRAVFFVSLSHVAVSTLELLMYVVFICFKLDRWMNMNLSCMAGFIGLGLYYVATFSWPFLPGQLKTFTEEEYLLYTTGNITKEPTGCNIDKFSWCLDTKPINVWVYYISFVMLMGSSFCAINITLNTIFSGVIGPRRQATHQGLLQMVGSLGRLVGPLIISNLYSSFGPQIAWISQMLLVAATITMWMAVYDRLTPIIVAKKSSHVAPQLK